MKKRVVSMVLALSMVSALFVVPISAAYTYSRDTASRDDISAMFYEGAIDDPVTSFLRDHFSLGFGRPAVGWFLFQWVCNRLVSTYGNYGVVSYDTLTKIAAQLNSSFVQWDGSAVAYMLETAGIKNVLQYNSFRSNVWQLIYFGSTPKFSVTLDAQYGIYRITLDVNSTISGYSWWGFFTDQNGDYWYAEAEVDDTGTPTGNDYAANDTSRTNGLVWMPSSQAVDIISRESVYICSDFEFQTFLTHAKTMPGASSVSSDTVSVYSVISNYVPSSSARFYLAYRFYYSNGTFKDTLLVKPNANLYTGTEQTVTDNTGNGSVTLNLGDLFMLDAVNKFMLTPEGDINFIDNVTFDNSTKTYNYTTNNEFNYYDNRSWSWTYHINYTSVTYIGQSEEYDKSYEFYYQLPDGRSSADLTREELEQLNLAVDVINYGRSADDVRLRSLYHFDGNTDDSSYWNYATSFTWNKGASITYMESGNFEGALYLDETEHDFTLTLPSTVGAGDFTLQFRIYQSYTASPQLDSYIQFGAYKVLQLNGSSIYNGSGSSLSAMPIGSWNELAIIRENGIVRLYLNGVQIGSSSNTNAFGDTITFHFGSVQQTYKEIDELRVLNYALATGGVNYRPTSVPHDTNLALVLPDSTVPIADEFLSYHSDMENLIPESVAQAKNWGSAIVNTIQGSNPSLSDYPVVMMWYPAYNYSAGILYGDFQTGFSQPRYISNITTLTPTQLGCVLNVSSYSAANAGQGRSALTYGSYMTVDPIEAYMGQNASGIANVGGVLAPTGGMIFTGQAWYSDREDYLYGDYTISAVLADGSILSLTNNFVNGCATKTVHNDTLQIRVGCFKGSGQSSGNPQSFFIQFVPYDNKGPEIVYVQIVKGDHTDLTAGWVSSVTLMDPASLNTPTLAVRSDIEVTNYQIGGVRPSIPSKGLVWAMVESGYITSLQIYDGRAWLAVDGRIWTGERWIPYSSYNVVTLSDMYDIADASGNSGYEYIYSESGFWSWLQKFLLKFREDLFAILQGGVVSIPEHQHVYATETLKEATCTESGLIQYSCTAGDHTYTAATDPLDHDWVAYETIEDQYSFPDTAHCPNDRDHEIFYTLDKDTGVYHVTCSDCGAEFDVAAKIKYGYAIYTCTRCGKSYRESNRDADGLFEAIGDFIADGILWIVDKLEQLVEALNSISKIFNKFAESFEESAGGYPEFFGQVLSVMPEDLMNIIWFAIIGIFAVAAWKKFFG